MWENPISEPKTPFQSRSTSFFISLRLYPFKTWTYFENFHRQIKVSVRHRRVMYRSEEKNSRKESVHMSRHIFRANRVECMGGEWRRKQGKCLKGVISMWMKVKKETLTVRPSRWGSRPGVTPDGAPCCCTPLSGCLHLLSVFRHLVCNQMMEAPSCCCCCCTNRAAEPRTSATHLPSFFYYYYFPHAPPQICSSIGLGKGIFRSQFWVWEIQTCPPFRGEPPWPGPCLSPVDLPPPFLSGLSLLCTADRGVLLCLPNDYDSLPIPAWSAIPSNSTMFSYMSTYPTYPEVGERFPLLPMVTNSRDPRLYFHSIPRFYPRQLLLCKHLTLIYHNNGRQTTGVRKLFSPCLRSHRTGNYSHKSELIALS